MVTTYGTILFVITGSERRRCRLFSVSLKPHCHSIQIFHSFWKYLFNYWYHSFWWPVLFNEVLFMKYSEASHSAIDKCDIILNLKPSIVYYSDIILFCDIYYRNIWKYDIMICGRRVERLPLGSLAVTGWLGLHSWNHWSGITLEQSLYHVVEAEPFLVVLFLEEHWCCWYRAWSDPSFCLLPGIDVDLTVTMICTCRSPWSMTTSLLSFHSKCLPLSQNCWPQMSLVPGWLLAFIEFCGLAIHFTFVIACSGLLRWVEQVNSRSVTLGYLTFGHSFSLSGDILSPLWPSFGLCCPRDVVWFLQFVVSWSLFPYIVIVGIVILLSFCYSLFIVSVVDLSVDFFWFVHLFDGVLLWSTWYSITILFITHSLPFVQCICDACHSAILCFVSQVEWCILPLLHLPLWCDTTTWWWCLWSELEYHFLLPLFLHSHFEYHPVDCWCLLTTCCIYSHLLPTALLLCFHCILLIISVCWPTLCMEIIQSLTFCAGSECHLEVPGGSLFCWGDGGCYWNVLIHSISVVHCSRLSLEVLMSCLLFWCGLRPVDRPSNYSAVGCLKHSSLCSTGTAGVRGAVNSRLQLVHSRYPFIPWPWNTLLSD